MCPEQLAKDLLDAYPANIAYTHNTRAQAADASNAPINSTDYFNTYVFKC